MSNLNIIAKAPRQSICGVPGRQKLSVIRRDALARLARRKPAPLDPTPEQIAEACDGIQAGWSSSERRSRCVMASWGWMPQENCRVDWCEG